MNLRELYGDIVDDVPEGYLDIFDELTGRGHRPSTVLATIEYIETPATQQEAAERYGATAIGVRRLYRVVLSRSDRTGMVSPRRGGDE